MENQDAGLPTPNKVVSNLITALEVDKDVIHMKFGNKANPQLQGKVLSIFPAVIEESQTVPIACVCGSGKPPVNMTLFGDNRTTIDAKFIPFACK